MMRTSSLALAVLCCTLTCLSPLAAKEPIKLANDPALSPDGSRLAFSWRGDVWIVDSRGGVARQMTQHAGLDRDPEFSPDGQRLAFVSTRQQGRNVFVMALEGAAPEQLTFHTMGHSLQGWFPDGKSLLTSAARDHFWSRPDRFLRISATERVAEEVLFDDYGSDGVLSPDGKKLLFVREGMEWWRKGYRGARAAQLWLYDLESRKFESLVQHEFGALWPLWKGNGQGCYYVDGRGGCFNLWEFDLGSKSGRQLTEFQDDGVVFPCISRDGSTIVFRQLLDLYLYRPEKNEAPTRLELFHDGDTVVDSERSSLLSQAREVAFSDDGLDIAFVAGGDVWVMDTELREPRQVTRTPEEERDLVFSTSGDVLWFVSDAEGETDIWQATRGDDKKYWWLNDQFTLKRMTQDAAVESNLKFSPDGKQLAYLRGTDLYIMNSDGQQAKAVLRSWDAPAYNWSPDGKWLAYAVQDEEFNSDVWILPLDGSRPAYNLSRHPDNEGAPVWSPDGKVLAFTGKRLDDETDVHYVYLREEDEQKSNRDKTLEKALEKVRKARSRASGSGGASGAGGAPNEPAPDEPTGAGPPGRQPPGGAPLGAGAPAPGRFRLDPNNLPPNMPPELRARIQERMSGGSTAPSANAATPPKPVQVVIDFERLHERLRRVAMPNSVEGNLLFSPDGKKLAFSGSKDGQRGLYVLDIGETAPPRLLSSTVGTGGRWIAAGDQIVWLANGVPASLSGSGRTTDYRFSSPHKVNLARKHRAAFDMAWRTMRDRYYDGRLGNRNWDAIRRKYSAAAEVPDVESLTTVVQLMLGELNGSHLGFMAGTFTTPPDPGAAPREPRSLEMTAHLGVRFDPQHKGPGLKIRDVVRNSPADLKASRLAAGEVILGIDGTTVDPGMDLTRVLNGPASRDLRLQVRNEKGEERTVVLRPTTYFNIRSLLYEDWIRRSRTAVEHASQGKLGYLHIRGMNMPSFYRFEEELYAVGAGKSGLVIDVRENGGGSTTDLLLTCLTQPVHAITVPRGGQPGYPQDRKVFATWNKPIIVLCNQNSFSNAEIFSHAIKTLRRGQLVGVPTAGGVISTGSTTIMDVGLLRLPFRGWYLPDTGQDMELNGAVPHHIVWPEPGQMPAGRDIQLDKAVELLLVDVKAYESRPRPKLINASERHDGSSN